MLSNIVPFLNAVKYLKLDNFFDIGSRDGDDAHCIASFLGIKDVYAFEPVSDSAKCIRDKYSYINTHELVVTDKDNWSSFYVHVPNGTAEERGQSSTRYRNNGVYDGNSEVIKVRTVRFDTWCSYNNIKKVDLVKIDVEGCTYEALVGFGDILNSVKAIHLECEVVELWDNQKLRDDIYRLLDSRFKLIHESGDVQRDQIWINRNELTPEYLSVMDRMHIFYGYHTR